MDASRTDKILDPTTNIRRTADMRLSTGLKMLIILAVALLPLGLIAAFASRESAHVNRLRHEAEARAMATAAAVSITDAFRPTMFGLRQAMDDLVTSADLDAVDRRQCELRLRGLRLQNETASGMAMYSPEGRRICATEDFSGLPVPPPADTVGYDVNLVARERLLRTQIAASTGGYFGVAEFAADRIMQTAVPPSDERAGITLRQGSQAIVLREEQSDKLLEQIIRVSAPVAGGQLSLEMRMPAAPISPLEILLILLPLLMWAAGAVIGWVVVERLLLYPLSQMQRAIAVFSSGGGPLVIPKLTTPAHEIRDLGESFTKATETLTRHEEELAEGLAAQKRLTREVHHRVKNNLQVVSSLINLHARGSTSDAVSQAYASIQRRVDALSVVHRNHYAELEENFGLSLRALIGEIASNLRASATGPMTVTLNLMSAAGTQDVAVPVAFLITEIMELVMHCAEDTHVAISLTPVEGNANRALLTIASHALTTEPCQIGPTVERFQRIAGGLARQLRAPLDYDSKIGRYAIEISILPQQDRLR